MAEIDFQVLLDQQVIDPQIPGWMPLKELKWLGMLAGLVPTGGRIVEIGSWCGRSTFAIGMNRVPGVRLTSIDTFLYTKGYRREDIRLDWLWGNHARFERFARIAERSGSWYPGFMESTHHLENIDVQIRDSRSVGIQTGITMAFIDGNHHGPAPLEDVMKFIDDPETLIVMDDCYRQWTDVIAAVMHVRDKFDRHVFLPAGMKLALILPKTGHMLEQMRLIINASLDPPGK